MRVFAYGTLMVPALVEGITGLRPAQRPARLEGWERRAVRGEVYPAIVPAPGAAVEGRLLAGVPRSRLAFLDRFEGPEYRRLALPVRLPDDRRLVAWCWVWAPGRRRALDTRPWEMDAFLADALPDYLRRCRRLGRACRRGPAGPAAGRRGP